VDSVDGLAVDTTPDADAIQAVEDALTAYNRAHAPEDAFQPLHIVVRDPRGHIVGGLLGATYWGWLVVETLWVVEGLRGGGYGRALLGMAEREAVQRGCHHAHLSTMSFQARPFYEQAGYTVFGTLHDLPQGHDRYFMHKALNTDADGATGARLTPMLWGRSTTQQTLDERAPRRRLRRGLRHRRRWLHMGG